MVTSGQYDTSEAGYSRENRGYYITIHIKKNGQSDNLANVLIRVYSTRTSDKVEAQMESVFRWME